MYNIYYRHILHDFFFALLNMKIIDVPCNGADLYPVMRMTVVVLYSCFPSVAVSIMFIDSQSIEL